MAASSIPSSDAELLPVLHLLRKAPGVRFRRLPFTFLKVAGACRYAKVDLRDYARARLMSWYTDCDGYPAGRWRRSLGGDGRKVTLHVFVLGRRRGYLVDHIDGDKHNCRRGNLRHVRQGINATNRSHQRRSRSGVRGVHKLGDGWQVQFTLRHRNHTLGAFAELGPACAVATLAIPLIYGRGTRLADGTPFDESQLEPLTAGAAAMDGAELRKLLRRTEGLGDDLSAQLREKLV